MMMQQGMVDDTSVRDMRIVRMKELTQILGISRSTIYDKLNPKSRRYDPRFPKPLRAYSHAWRSLNNIHADHVITSMSITQ